MISSVDSPISPSLTTRDLLEQFERTGNPAPFEELMRRYGAMVFNVCYKVTRDKHDAEDATQATFLTLAVRARQTKKIEYLGPWLQKVGHRVALDISRSKRRRAAREQRHGEMERVRQSDAPQLRQEGASQGVLLDELKQALREELDKLPTKYRLPLILHYFGGLRPEEVAREMKLNASTLGVRLHRGRKLLADAMSARGFSLSVAAVATMLETLVRESVIDGMVSTSSYAAAQVAAGASVPVGVAPDVFALASSATRGLALSRLKALAAVFVLLGGGVTGGASIAYRYLPEIELRLHDVLRWIEPSLRSTPLVPHIERPPVRLAGNPSGAGDASDDHDAGVQAGAIASLLPMSREIPSIPQGTPPVSSETLAASSSSSIAERAGSAEPGGSRRFDRQSSAASWLLASVPAVGSFPVVVTSGAARPITRLSMPTLTIDRQPSRSATDSAIGASVRSLDVAGSAWHGSGALRLDTLRIDSDEAPASLDLAGGDVHARQIVVGDRGRGTLRQTGGTLRADATLTIASQPGSSGAVLVQGGSLAAGTLAVGVAGQGIVEQTGGYVLVSIPEKSIASGNILEPMSSGSLALGVESAGQGDYLLRAGTLSAERLLVGVGGHGNYQQTGGRAQFDAVALGVAETGSGIVQLAGGDLGLRSSDLEGHALDSAVVIGHAGAGVLRLGGDHDAFQLVERRPDAGVPLVVRATEDGDGVIHGWGKVTLTGPFVQNGRVIADGFGKPRLLDFSASEFVVNTIDNAPGAANGWFARDGGALRLPPLRIFGDGDYTWGESPTDPELDLVNSLRLTLHEVTVGGTILVTLHTRADQGPRDVPAPSLLALWELDGGDVRFGSADVVLRYDDVQLAMLGGDPTQLKLYGYDGSWKSIVTDRLALDAERSLLRAALDRPYERLALVTTGSIDDMSALPIGPTVVDPGFVVGRGSAVDPGLLSVTGTVVVPEPAAGTIVLLGFAGAMLRRRRSV